MRRLLLIALLVGLIPAVASALPITYTGAQAVGASTASLSITTDGTIGVLQAWNIIDWTIGLNDGTDSFTLRSTNSTVYIAGGPLSATNSSLLFDFSYSDISGGGAFLVQHPYISSGGPFYCAQINGCFDFGGPGQAAEPDWDYHFDRTFQTGSYVLASVSSVPEPGSSLFLFGIGLAGLKAWKQRLG
jgi:hypothetical protein